MRTVTSLPYFLRWIDCHISLAVGHMELRGAPLLLISDKRHLLNMGKIHQSIGSGGIESMTLLKKRSALITTTKWTVWLKLAPRKCWHDIKSVTGQDTFEKREWYHQFLSDVITSSAELATQITLKCITQEPLMPARSQPKLRPT